MGDTVKDMTAKFRKLYKFEGNDLRRWQKKMHFLITTLKVLYVSLTFTQHDMNRDESISVSSIIDKLPPFWKDFKHSLKNNKDELSLVKLGSHFRIEEILKAEESGKGNGKEIVGSSSIIMIEDGKNKNNNKNNKAKKRKNDEKELWHQLGSKYMAEDASSKKFFVSNFNNYKMVDSRSNRARVAKSFGSDFKLYLVEGSRDHIGPQYSYCYSIEEDPRTFDEAMQSHQMDKTKLFLSLSFSMKDMGEADVILVNTPLDLTIKLMPNTSKDVDQLEYSRAIGCLMYAMTSTRPYIVYAVGKVSRYTSNPSTHHWHAIKRLFKYLKKTIDYGLSYVGFPLVLKVYSNPNWITNSEDHTSTTGWVFLLGKGGAILWASKK
nr:zinc finger, CCHC-type [Tanacetum cinerariifolium]